MNYNLLNKVTGNLNKAESKSFSHIAALVVKKFFSLHACTRFLKFFGHHKIYNTLQFIYMYLKDNGQLKNI